MRIIISIMFGYTVGFVIPIITGYTIVSYHFWCLALPIVIVFQIIYEMFRKK